MGSCCDIFFRKEEIHTNQSRLKLLENKVSISYSTQNDNKFTYYLNLYHQIQFLHKILSNFKQFTEQTEDNSQFELHPDEVNLEYQKFNRYMKDFNDENSQLQKAIKRDQQKITNECQLNKSKWLDCQSACLIKLEIQDIQLIQGITRIGFIKDGPYHNKANAHEYLIVNRLQREKVYREFIFPKVNSKLKIVTDPINSSMTFDLDDLAKNQVICGIFTFKNKEQQFGYLAVRLQYVTRSLVYRKQKMENLAMIERQLKLCLQGKDGLNRLSQYRSDTGSHRHTFISDDVSEYNNQYHV